MESVTLQEACHHICDRIFEISDRFPKAVVLLVDFSEIFENSLASPTITEAFVNRGSSCSGEYFEVTIRAGSDEYFFDLGDSGCSIKKSVRD